MTATSVPSAMGARPPALAIPAVEAFARRVADHWAATDPHGARDSRTTDPEGRRWVAMPVRRAQGTLCGAWVGVFTSEWEMVCAAASSTSGRRLEGGHVPFGAPLGEAPPDGYRVGVTANPWAVAQWRLTGVSVLAAPRPELLRQIDLPGRPGLVYVLADPPVYPMADWLADAVGVLRRRYGCLVCPAEARDLPGWLAYSPARDGAPSPREGMLL